MERGRIFAQVNRLSSGIMFRIPTAYLIGY
jgi:hypothetical protein